MRCGYRSTAVCAGERRLPANYRSEAGDALDGLDYSVGIELAVVKLSAFIERLVGRPVRPTQGAGAIRLAKWRR